MSASQGRPRAAGICWRWRAHGRAIGPGTGPLVKRLDPLQDPGALSGSLRWRSLCPGVVAAGGKFQHSTHRGDRIRGLMRSHELERPDGTESVSRANQAAALARISRSNLSWRFSRRSRRISSFSSVVAPSLRPSSTSPCCTSAEEAPPDAWARLALLAAASGGEALPAPSTCAWVSWRRPPVAGLRDRSRGWRLPSRSPWASGR